MKRGIARFLSFCRCFLQARFAGANPSQTKVRHSESASTQAIRLRWSGYIIIPLILFFLCSPLEAGTWAKTFGGISNEAGTSIQQTGDGGYILTGDTNSFGAGNNDVLVLRLDSSGTIVWQKTFGGANNDDFGYSIQQTSDGGYILTGDTNSFGAGVHDVLVLRLDSNGSIVWQKTFGGANEDFGQSIKQTGDGGYILTGYTRSFGAGNADVLVLRLDSGGNVVWQRTFGGANEDFGQSIKQTGDGGYILTGYTNSFGAGFHDVLVLRLDSGGNIVWQRTFSGARNDWGQSIQQTSDGGYILTGFTYSFGAGNRDVLVLRLDSGGNIVWQKTFGGANDDFGYSIQQTGDGGYILTGNTTSFGAGNSDVLVLRLDSSGNVFGCGDFSDINMTVNTPSVTVSNINSTVTDPNRSMANVGVTVSNPSVTAGTKCTYTGSRDDLVVDFGDPFGINVYQNNTGPWTRIHHFSPGEGRMVVGDLDGNGKDDIIVDFGTAFGINVYHNNVGPWTRVHHFSPGAGRMVVGDLDGNGQDDLIVDFGDPYGINVYYNNTGPWTRIHHFSPGADRMVVRDLDGNGKDDVIVDFGPDFGINVYYNNAGPWTRIHHFSPGAGRMIVGDLDGNGKGDVIVDFGTAFGINVYHNNVGPWTRIHHFSPGAGRMIVGDMDGNGKGDVIVDFGTDFGINVYHNNAGPWTRIHHFSPGAGRMAAGDMDENGKNDVIVDFGTDFGINVYHNNVGPWTRVHHFSPGTGRMVTGNMNGN